MLALQKQLAPSLGSGLVVNSFGGKNAPEREDYLMERLVVPVEESDSVSRLSLTFPISALRRRFFSLRQARRLTCARRNQPEGIRAIHRQGNALEQSRIRAEAR